MIRNRIFKRITVAILIIAVLFVGTGLIVVYFYKDKVKNIVTAGINKQLNSEVNFEDFNLSLFKKFPYASVRFSKILAKDAIQLQDKGILLEAESIYLQFSILDIFRKNYKIKRIEINDASLNIKVFKDLTDNYHFWKKSPDSAGKSFSFDLKRIILNNTKITYINDASDQNYELLAKNVFMQGKFSTDDYFLFVKGDFFINHFLSSGVNYFKDQETKIKLNFWVNSKANFYEIKEGVLDLYSLSFDICGKIRHSDNLKSLDLIISGKEIDMQSLIDELPGKFKSDITEYNVEGVFDFRAEIHGKYGGSDLPGVTARFGLNNGQIVKRGTPITLDSVYLKGYYSNGKTEETGVSLLKIEDFSAKLKTGKINGSFGITDLNHPEIYINTIAVLNLSELQEFLEIDTIESINGTLDMNFIYRGRPEDINNLRVKDFIHSHSSGMMNISDMNFRFVESPNEYSNINGAFSFNNNDIIVDNITGRLSGSDFNLKGHFKNVLPFLFFSNEKIHISVDFSSSNINLEDLLQTETGKGDSDYNLTFSDNIYLDLNVKIDKLKFRKFIASDVLGKIIYSNKKLLAENFSLKTMKGNISVDGLMDGTKENEFLIKCNATISNVDASEMFYQFGNFGQESLTDKNIKGWLSAKEVKFIAKTDKDLTIDLSSIYAIADIIIENGELIDYAPMQGLSNFIKVEDLAYIKFSTLKNQIKIKDKEIEIPKMEIKSSAINIEVSGKHKFNSEIDYHLKILLSELLAKKAKKAKKENELFGEIEDDGLGKTSLFIHVFGTVENPKYKYDKKGVREKLKSDWQKEKLILKKIFQEDIKLFKKDSVSKYDSIMKTLKEGEMIIEWEEDDY